MSKFWGMVTEGKPCLFDVSDGEWALVAQYLVLLREDAGQRVHPLHNLFEVTGTI
jgi:hypothetical protein